jgi:hypothetical protein
MMDAERADDVMIVVAVFVAILPVPVLPAHPAGSPRDSILTAVHTAECSTVPVDNFRGNRLLCLYVRV